MKTSLKMLLTGAVVAAAVAAALAKYWDFVVNPWTRNGQVQANVIQIAARVSAPIIDLAVTDNQFVRTGDLLFALDPRTFRAALDQARAALQKARDDNLALQKSVEAAEARVEAAQAAVEQAEIAIKQIDATIARNRAEYARQQELLPQRATSQRAVEAAKASFEVSVEQRRGAVASVSQARASLGQARADLAQAQANLGAPGAENAAIRQAEAAVREAELNLEFTQVQAPVDGYVTNLKIREGTQAVANQPAVALIDVNSFWVFGFFRETSIGDVRQGDKAIVTLMSYPDRPLEGHVGSLGWGIAQSDGSTGDQLLPNVSPTFEWIRLAQRVPVRINIDKVPDGVELRVGTTASVLVKTGTGGSR